MPSGVEEEQGDDAAVAVVEEEPDGVTTWADYDGWTDDDVSTMAPCSTWESVSVIYDTDVVSVSSHNAGVLSVSDRLRQLRIMQ